MMPRTLLLLAFVAAAAAAIAQRTLTVAQDGTGDYSTIQAAIDAAPEGEATTIRVRAGDYAEHVAIGSRQRKSTKRITLIGDGIDRTIITSAIGMKGEPRAKNIYATAALAVFADDFYAQDLTLRNTAGKAGGQALALDVDGDRQTFCRCRIASYQDTHRSKKNTRSYYQDCIIEGAVDFIYAGGTCWFERCELRCVGRGWITAPEDIAFRIRSADRKRHIWLGFIFNRCTVTKGDGVADGDVALGRPWNKDQAGAGSIYLNCQLGGIVKAQGWDLMGGSTGRNTCFAEYGSRDGDQPADVSERAKWSRQLSDEDYHLIDSWQKVDALWLGQHPEAQPFTPVILGDTYK